MSAGAVSLSHVTKIYPGAATGSPPAVDDVSIDTAGGEILTLLGASGSGKSTTLRIIAGLERLTSGEVRIDGRVVSSPSVHVPTHKRQIGMVFQSYAVWPHMTVLDNVAFPLKVAGVKKGERHATAREKLAEVALTEYADRLPGSLSGGQQQRVALARAIVGDPRIILYDEPLSNLDARLRDRLRERIRALHERLGITAIYVTHDQREAMAISDRIAMMEQGMLQQIGTPQSLYQEPTRRSVAEFVGDANMLLIQKLDLANKRAFISDRICVQLPAHIVLEDEPEASRYLVVRPQYVRVVPADYESSSSDNAFFGTVSRTRFFGDHFRVFVELDDDLTVVAELTPGTFEPDLSAGQRVGVVLNSQLCAVVS